MRVLPPWPPTGVNFARFSKSEFDAQMASFRFGQTERENIFHVGRNHHRFPFRSVLLALTFTHNDGTPCECAHIQSQRCQYKPSSHQNIDLTSKLLYNPHIGESQRQLIAT